MLSNKPTFETFRLTLIMFEYSCEDMYGKVAQTEYCTKKIKIENEYIVL